MASQKEPPNAAARFMGFFITGLFGLGIVFTVAAVDMRGNPDRIVLLVAGPILVVGAPIAGLYLRMLHKRLLEEAVEGSATQVSSLSPERSASSRLLVPVVVATFIAGTILLVIGILGHSKSTVVTATITMGIDLALYLLPTRGSRG